MAQHSKLNGIFQKATAGVDLQDAARSRGLRRRQATKHFVSGVVLGPLLLVAATELIRLWQPSALRAQVEAK